MKVNRRKTAISAKVPAGHIDVVLKCGSTLLLRGWAGHPSEPRPADHVLLVANDGRIVGMSEVCLTRPDVVQVLGQPAMLRCGWGVAVDLETLGGISMLRVYALSGDDAGELDNSPLSYPWSEPGPRNQAQELEQECEPATSSRGTHLDCGLSTSLELDPSGQERLRATDRWFFDHYIWAADTVADNLSRIVPLPEARVLDFGCGDGIMALGVVRRGARHVTGLDLRDWFKELPSRARRALGRASLPSNLAFHLAHDGDRLPFSDEQFDAVYSWSVFEHVRDVPVALKEIERVMRPGGVLFLQISPLYYSPFGSHMRQFLDEPWAHLVDPTETFIDRVRASRPRLDEDERRFEESKAMMIADFLDLNRITAGELVDQVSRVGFRILARDELRLDSHEIPASLAGRYSEVDLRLDEIKLLLGK